MFLPSNAFSALHRGLLSSFVDASIDSEPQLRTRLLTNGTHSGASKLLSILEQELSTCARFDFSVAFVTMSGITPLLLVLQELEARGVPGRILTSDYLQFTEPEALEKLSGLANLEVRIFRVGEAGNRVGFHTKGYVFGHDNLCSIIVGSSNLTQSALCTNQEWNARVVSASQGEFARQIHTQFEALWTHPATHRLEEVLQDYRGEYQTVRSARRRFFEPEQTLAAALEREVRPNLMQKRLADNVLTLLRCEEPGDDVFEPKKGLLISATGTGKTYASAFVVKAVRPKTVLFLVHREQIARKARESYQRVLGNAYSYGFFIGQRQDKDCTCVFATMQTMVRHLDDGSFGGSRFEMIVIDEVHRAGAESYQRIMRHFRPRLWFGMTATPDRPDGIDIYALFDHHILTEIRLQQALESDLLCPFHYFGITGLSVSDKDYKGCDLARLTSDERVDHVLRQSRYFGSSGSRIKALVFCSSNEEARTFSEKFSARGARSTSLSNSDPQSVRERACARLASDKAADALEYIFSVDVFNEGIDIPEVNQIILLRPTKSPIVFVQQIGRGLRKHNDKEYVVILDFIGQCETNFMIPMALTGDRSYSKESMRRATAGTTELLSGPSSVHLDAVARERIYRAIDSARTNSVAVLREAYRLLRFKLGRVPSLKDFDEHGSIDPIKIFELCGSYHNFLRNVVQDPEYTVELSAAQEKFLTYLTTRLGKAQRDSEARILESILRGHTHDLRSAFIAEFIAEHSACPSKQHLRSCELLLTSNFWPTTAQALKNADCAVITVENEHEWRLAEPFARSLADGAGFRAALSSLVAFVRHRYRLIYRGEDRETFLKLYERYTYADVCRLLNWERNMPAQNIGGYFYDRTTKTLPVFINYHKTERAIAYEDRFVAQNHLIALSKTKRGIDSPDADHIFKRTQSDRDNRIYLFVRKDKNDKETKSFYYLGEVSAQGDPLPVRLSDGSSAFEINYRLEKTVREDIYAYLTS